MTNLMDLLADIEATKAQATLGGMGTTAGSEASGMGASSGFDPVGGGTDPVYGGMMQQAMSLLGQKGGGGGGGGAGGNVGGGTGIQFGNAFDPKDDLVTRRGVTLQQGAMNSLMSLSNPMTNKILDAIGGGYRSHQAQIAAYNAYKNGTGNMAATPGHSYHEYGAAFDLANQLRQRLQNALKGLGWRNKVPGEWWHWSIGNAPWGGN